MAIKTDNVAYTSNAPWRGHGIAVNKDASPTDMLKAAGLDWEVKRTPLKYDDGTDVPGFYALRKGDTNITLDIVKGRYIPTQNAPAFEFFSDFLAAGDATMEYVGSFMDGKIVWGLANLNTTFSVGRKDPVNGYLFLALPHIKGKSVIARITTVRDVCNNSLSIALRAKSSLAGTFRMNHRNEFNKVQQDRARNVLGMARSDIKEFGKVANDLSKAKVTTEEAAAFIAHEYQPDWDGSMDNLGPRMKQVMHAYEHAPGAQPGTRWGVINAVTYYADHLAGGDERRLVNSWVGRGGRQKEAVVARLTA